MYSSFLARSQDANLEYARSKHLASRQATGNQVVRWEIRNDLAAFFRRDHFFFDSGGSPIFGTFPAFDCEHHAFLEHSVLGMKSSREDRALPQTQANSGAVLQ
jgi:hypothetical protein